MRGNAATNVTVLASALGDASGELNFADTQLDDQNFVLKDGAGVSVPVVTLDELFLLRLDRVDLLKLDVEGYELAVLRGANAVLQRTECVYFESWDEHCTRYGSTVGDVIAQLESAGFRVFRREGTQLHPVGRTHVSPHCENLVATRDVVALMARVGAHGFTVVLTEAA